MAVLNLRLFGDPVLRTPADPVSVDPRKDRGLSTLVDNMLLTMDHYGGVGLAANQVGVTRRVFVFDCEGDRGHVINPHWEAIGEETQTGSEGCLSIPGVRGEVTRAERVRLRGIDLAGHEIDRVANGLLARCVQHECDHLDGVLFLKHLAAEDRKLAMKNIHDSEWFK